MDAFSQARDNSERGKGIPFTDEERAARHYANYGTTNLPPRGTGLQSIGLLQQLSEDPTAVSKTDLIGLLGGGALGLYVSTKFPKAVVKYIGIIVGAELGIMIVRAMKAPKGSV